MLHRRTFAPFVVVLLSSAGCLLRPIDPNPAAARPSQEQPAQPELAQPQAQTSPAQPAQIQPVQPEPTQPAPVQPQPTQPQPAQPQPPQPQPAQPQPVQPQPVQPQPAQPQPAQPWPSEPLPTRTAPAQRSRPGTVTDANIAAMVLALNNTDISYARLVPARAQRDDVRKFAERMLTDHIGVNGLVTELLHKLDLAAVDNPTSLDMRDESADKRDILRELDGFAFDSTYMENEVAYHQKFLRTIDEVMIPSARNDDLRTLLINVRPAVAAHLAHAEQTRANVLAKK
jgi:putative membrane protein